MLLDREPHARVHPGLQAEAGIRNLDFHLRRARRRIENRREPRDAAVEILAGIRVDFDVGRRCPGEFVADSFSTTLMTRRTVRMSTTEMNDVFTPTLAPGSSVRLPMNPSTGAVMIVFARLIFSSSRRARACAICACASSSCAMRRLVARVGVVERLAGQQVALVEALRALHVVLRELQVGLPLPDRRLRHVVGRFRLLDLLDDLAIFDLGDRLSAAHRIAELHVHRSRRPWPRGTASTVAAPIRLPTTMMVVGHSPARDRRELDRHRRAWAAAESAADPTRHRQSRRRHRRHRRAAAPVPRAAPRPALPRLRRGCP